jgi:acyl dehydratase
MMGATIDELRGRIGQEIGVSDWVLVDQEMIDKFADATGDHQFIHVNPDMAKMTPFGGTIAHGFLTLSLMARLQQSIESMTPSGVRMGLNYGGNKVRFLTPVRSGSRVRGRFKLLDLDEKRPGQFQQTFEYTLEIEGVEKPAVVAEWIIQLFV